MSARAALLGTLRPGRRVECDVRGRRFWARLVERTVTGWRVQPETGNYHNVTTRQIIGAEREWHPSETQRFG